MGHEKKVFLLGSVGDCLSDEQENRNKTLEEQNIKSNFSINEHTMENVLNDTEKCSERVQLSEGKTTVLNPYLDLKDPYLPCEKNEDQENVTNVDRERKLAFLGSIEDCVNDE